jgi:hypothetical protein
MPTPQYINSSLAQPPARAPNALHQQMPYPGMAPPMPVATQYPQHAYGYQGGGGYPQQSNYSQKQLGYGQQHPPSSQAGFNQPQMQMVHPAFAQPAARPNTSNLSAPSSNGHNANNGSLI